MAKNLVALIERGRRAWLEIQYRLAGELYELIPPNDEELQWTSTGMELKGFASLFSALERLHDEVDAKSASPTELPGFAVPGNPRQRLGAITHLFPDKNGPREETLVPWYAESASPTLGSVASQKSTVVDATREALIWFDGLQTELHLMAGPITLEEFGFLVVVEIQTIHNRLVSARRQPDPPPEPISLGKPHVYGYVELSKWWCRRFPAEANRLPDTYEEAKILLGQRPKKSH